MKTVYVIGALRNPKVPVLSEKLRDIGFDVFDDWFSPGPKADEWWQNYESNRGRTYKEALNGYHANHVFQFDKFHLDRADIGILMMPAGRSGHLELGYIVGAGKPGYVLFEEEPERYDIMYRFAEDVFFDIDELVEAFKELV